MTATDTGKHVSAEDATKVRAQPSLTTSTGAIWLIVGGLLAATGIAILAPMIGLGAAGVAVGGIIAIVGLYAGMVLVRLLTPPGRLRLGLLAAAMIAIAIVELGCIGAITTVEWNIVA